MRGVRFTSTVCLDVPLMSHRVSCCSVLQCVDESQSLVRKCLLLSKETCTRDDARVSIRLFWLWAFMFDWWVMQSLFLSVCCYQKRRQKRRAYERMREARFTSFYFYAFAFIHLSIFAFIDLHVSVTTSLSSAICRMLCRLQSVVCNVSHVSLSINDNPKKRVQGNPMRGFRFTSIDFEHSCFKQGRKKQRVRGKGATESEALFRNDCWYQKRRTCKRNDVRVSIHLHLFWVFMFQAKKKDRGSLSHTWMQSKASFVSLFS